MNKTYTLIALAVLSSQTLYAYEDRPEPSAQDVSGQDFHAKILQKFDKDQDNQISKAEAPKKMKQRFSHHDLDGDGYIAGAELDTLPKRKHKNGNKGNKGNKCQKKHKGQQ
ncbi:MAG: hypothetical protein Q9M36_03475 [Sulfurovum sp.]|nr:hypothetical protein [Sulfurovum sp.]